MKGARPRRLCDILEMREDPSLEVVGFSVEDDTVRIEIRTAGGIHVRKYRGGEARRVAADLAVRMDYGHASGSEVSAAVG